MKKLRSEKPQNTEMFKSILDDSMRARVRARNLNAIEEDKLQKMNKIIEKERRHRENVRSRVLQRTEKTFKEKNALQKVLSKDYRVDNFMTMQKGFKKPFYQPPREARRFKVETRIYHSGFGVRALRPEINREMRQVDRDTVHRILQKVLAEKCLEVNDVPVERTLPDSEMYQKLFDRVLQTDRTIRKRNDVLYHSLRDVTPSPSTSRTAIFKTSDYAQTPVRLNSGSYMGSYNNLHEIPEISVRPKPQPGIDPDYERSIQEVSVSQQFDNGNHKNDYNTRVSVKPSTQAKDDMENTVTHVSVRPLDGIKSPNKNYPDYKVSQTHLGKNGGQLPTIPKPTSVKRIHKIVEEVDSSIFSGNDEMDNRYNSDNMSDMLHDDEEQIDTVDNNDRMSYGQTHQSPVNENRLYFISEILDNDERSSPNDRDIVNHDNAEQNFIPLDRTQSSNSLKSSSDQWQFKTADSDDNDKRY